MKMKMKCILALDDMPPVLSLIRSMLRTQYQVFPFTCADTAMEFLEQDDVVAIDCVLLDIDMPGISGIEVLRTLKSHPALRDVPVIMVTGNSDRDTVLKAIQAGAKDYIVKPFTEDILKKKIRSVLHKE